MTPKPDDRPAFVDPRVADAWREASSEEPSTAVDDAILAAARREVSARPEAVIAWEAREARASRRRWWPLAAAATVAAIAIGVLQLTPTDKLVSPATESATVSDVPAPSTKPDAGVPGPTPSTLAPVIPPPDSAQPALAGVSTLATSETAQPSPAPTPPSESTPFPAAKPAPLRPPSQPKVEKWARGDDAEAKGDAQRIEPYSTPPAAPAPTYAAPPTISAVVPAAPSEPPARPRSEAAANLARESDSVARQAASPRPAAPAPPAPLAKMAAAPSADSSVADARAKDRKPLPVPDWIALIRRLRAEGKPDEAAKELAAFRAAHADHEKLLPPDLRDWRPPEK